MLSLHPQDRKPHNRVKSAQYSSRGGTGRLGLEGALGLILMRETMLLHRCHFPATFVGDGRITPAFPMQVNKPFAVGKRSSMMVRHGDLLLEGLSPESEYR